MLDGLRVFGRAFALWWHDVLLFSVLNLAWLALIGILAVDVALKRPGMVAPEPDIELEAP